MKGLLAGLSALALMAAQPVHAQIGNTKGLFVGAQFTGASLNADDAARKIDFGGGFGLHAGIGFGQRWSLLVNYDKSTLKQENLSDPVPAIEAEDLELVQYDALLRINLITAKSPFRPFLTAGATARGVEGSNDFGEISPTAGGGLIVKIIPRIAITGTALYTFGNIKSAGDVGDNDGSIKATGARVQVGASLYLLGH